MKIYLIIIACLIGIRSSAQEKSISLRIYIRPSICSSPTQHRVFNDGKVRLSNLTKSSGLFLGGGLELIKPLNNNWLVGGDLGFVSKGYFATDDSTYTNGSLSGTSFVRTDLNFLETTVFIEKQFLLNNPKYKLIFSTGLFYGLHTPAIVRFGLEANGSDFGTSLSAGIKRKHSFVKLVYEKGLINIRNNVNSNFKTNILSIKVGYIFNK